MNGQQHLTAGVSLSVLSVAMYNDILSHWTDETTLNVMISIKDFVIPSNIILWPVCVVFLLLGLLLPDCDNEKSLIGRYFHIPIEHRTWVHTIWFILLVTWPCVFFKPFVCLGIGCFFHLLCDSFSKCGVCWFYPKYKKYGFAKVKKGHFIYLYGSEPVAWILCGVMITFTVLYILGSLHIIGPIHALIVAVDGCIESLVSFIVGIF